MAITISGENNNDRILASDGVIDSLSGFNVVGVITATSFTGDLTGDVTGNLTGNVTGNINNTTLLLQTGGTERLRIASDGKSTFNEDVRIVKTSGALLEVTTNTGAADATLRLSEGATGSTTNGGGMFYSGADNKLHITCGTDSTTKRITINRDDGKIGIGTHNPDHNLHVHSSSGDSVITIESTGNGNHSALEFIRTSSQGDSKGAGSIYVTGDTSTSAAKMNFGVAYNISHGTYPKMTIEGQYGRVGIGTINPTDVLDVYSTTDPTIRSRSGSSSVGANVEICGGSSNDSQLILSSGTTSKYQFFRDGSQSDDLRIYDSANSLDIIRYRHGGYLHFGVNGQERLRITADGKIGIGVENPSHFLHLKSASSPSIKLEDTTNTNILLVYAQDSDSHVGTYSNHPLVFDTNSTERLRIASDGGVGINTDKTRNTKNVSIAGVTRDYTNSGTDLVDAGGIILQPTITLPSTGQAYPGIFWSGNTGALGRARAGITGVAASNNDASDLVFLTKNSGSGHGLYPSDERLRINSSGHLKHTGVRSGNSENKLAILTAPSYNTSEEDVIIYQAENESGFNQLSIGGGTGSLNAMTALSFRTASSVNTTGGDERLRIDSSGNVLVGTTDTTIYNNGDSASEGIVLRGGSVIDIARKGDLQLILNRQTNDGPHIAFYRSGNAKSYISTRNDAFCIDVGGTSEKLRIDSNNRFYFMTTSQGPHGGKFNIDGTDENLNTLNVKGNSVNYVMISSSSKTNGNHIYFTNRHSGSNVNTGTIKDNGSNASYNTSSDYRIKENIVSISDGITRLKQLNPVRHTFKNNSSAGTVDGWVAHELDTVCPYAVVGEKDAVNEDGTDDLQGVDYGRITPLIVAALKEAIAKVETLEAEVAALKGS